MSRNKYDSSTGTLTQIGGWQGVDNALSDTSENPVQNKILKGVLDKTYKDDDTAETAIADGDYFPYYDVSASAKRKTLWSNVVSKLKNVFATTTTVAPIETTTTASRAYTTGQQFILNGILYKATANISSGGTINTGSGGNATTAADVTSQISNLDNRENSRYSEYTTVKTFEGTATAAADNTVSISSNDRFFWFSRSLFIKSGSLTCTLLFGGKYYVRLQQFNISQLKDLIPAAETVAVGGLIKSIATVVTNQNSNNTFISNILLVKESATEARLICDIWSSDTSGNIVKNDPYQIGLRVSGAMSIY